MHIILGEQATKSLEEKYIILELDSFYIADKDSAVPAFCLVENVPLHELPEVDQFRDLHTQMMRNYRLGNWKFCEDALEHLQGRWNGEVDSFYQQFAQRVSDLRKQKVDMTDWDPSIRI